MQVRAVFHTRMLYYYNRENPFPMPQGAGNAAVRREISCLWWNLHKLWHCSKGEICVKSILHPGKKSSIIDNVQTCARYRSPERKTSGKQNLFSMERNEENTYVKDKEDPGIPAGIRNDDRSIHCLRQLGRFQGI
jgi:hypothetical protein